MLQFAGATFTVTAVTQLMQDFVDNRAAVEAAQAATKAKIDVERTAAPSQLAVIRAFGPGRAAGQGFSLASDARIRAWHGSAHVFYANTALYIGHEACNPKRGAQVPRIWHACNLKPHRDVRGAGMNWEERFLNMALAGGAVAAVACADNGVAGGSDASPEIGPDFCCNANPDVCCSMLCGGEGPDSSPYVLCEQDRATCLSHDGFYETLDDGGLGCSFRPEGGPCCEANPDPCCTCGGPDAALDPAGCAGKMAC